MVWLNTPSNPTGAVLDLERMSAIVRWAQDQGIPLVSDECYIELGWDTQPTSILDPRVNGGDLRGLLAVHSLSKRSSMAGYRFGFVAGDPALVDDLLAVRKHLGMMVPAPVQHAAIAAYDDDTHVAVQRDRYQARREILMGALVAAGFRIDHSEAGRTLGGSPNGASWWHQEPSTAMTRTCALPSRQPMRGWRLLRGAWPREPSHNSEFAYPNRGVVTAR
jgi:aspartate/methionine/tyrosine aminotransferase